MTLEEKLEQAMARAAMLREALTTALNEALHASGCNVTNDAIALRVVRESNCSCELRHALIALDATEADVSAWLAERDARHAAELRDAKADRVVLEARWEKAAAELAKVTAERDEALLNSKAIDEAEFMRRIDERMADREVPDIALTPMGKMLFGLRERALAAEADAERLAGALREAYGGDHRIDCDVNHNTSENMSGCNCGWSDAESALAQHKTGAALEAERERVRAEALKEWNQQEWVERRDARVYAEALEEAAKAAETATLPPKYRWGNDVMEAFEFGAERAALAVRTLASTPAKRETP